MSVAPPVKAPVADPPSRATRVMAIQRLALHEEADADVEHCACGGACPNCRSKTVQAKLAISRPGDFHEREADRVADAIAALPSGSTRPVVATVTPFAPSTGGDGVLMRSVSDCGPGQTAESIATQLDARSGQGAMLPPSTRERMESGLGADFTAVRVHADAGGDRMARGLHARAFTHGSDIYFRSGEYQPGTPAGDWLLAHELTHVEQQRTAPASSTRVVQRLPETLSAAWDGVTTTVRSGAARVEAGVRAGADVVQDAAGTVRDAAVDVARSARDLVEGYLQEHAPGVLAFLRGDIIGEIKRRIYQGLDYLFNGLGQRIRTEGLTETMRGVFGEFVEGVSQIASDLSDGNCDSLFAAMQMIRDFGDRLTGPAFRELREIAGDVASFFSDLWNKFGQPSVDAIQELAGSVWTWITTQAQWLWDQTADVRQWFHDAWEEYKRRFNIAWHDAGSVLDDLRAKAVQAWEDVKRELGPWLLPLQIAAGALLLFSPLGPIVATAGGVYLLIEAIGWIQAHWDDINEMVVTARQYLHDNVLTPILRDLQWLGGMLQQAGEWIGEQVTALVAALNSLLEALGLAPMIAALRRVVGSIVRELVRAADYVSTEVRRAFAEVRRIALEVHRAVRPFYGLIAAIILFPQYPFLLPIVLTGWAWRLSPDCIKPPIIDFALDMMILGVRAIPEFGNFGDAWPHARSRIIETLEQARGMSFEEKVAASDRAARIMTGEDIEWIFNLVEAAWNAPSHFGEQMEEEVGISMLDEVLPFERGAAPTGDAPRDAAIATGDLSLGDASVLTRPRITEDDVVIESVPEEEMSDELEADLNLASGEETEIAGGAGPHAFDEMRAELAGAPEVAPGTTTATGVEGPETAAGSGPGAAGDDTEARLRAMIDRPLEGDCEESREPAATQADFPEELKFGPLTRGQRARYLVAQMGKAFSHWFGCNRHWLIPTIILAIVGLIAIEILTEGAITAALPAIMEILVAVFIGVAAVRVSYYIGRYIAMAIAGEKVEAAKSLARGFAVAAIELLFALLFNLGAVIRTVRAGARASVEAVVGAARGVVTRTAQAVGTLGRTVSRGSRALVGNVRSIAGAALRNGRIAIQGLRRGFSNGVRSFRQLLSRLSHLRFRGFSISRAGAVFTVWAHVNPKWPIATILLRLDRIRRQIALIVDEAEIVVRQGRGVYRRFIELSRADRDLVQAVLRRNRALLDEVRRLKNLGRLDVPILDDFLHVIEGHHAVPMWMGGPLIPQGSPELLGVARILHNFDPAGFHQVLNRVWRASSIFGHITNPGTAAGGQAVRAMFRAASPARRRVLLQELRTILTASYRETFGAGTPAFRRAIEAMEEGLAAFRY